MRASGQRSTTVGAEEPTNRTNLTEAPGGTKERVVALGAPDLDVDLMPRWYVDVHLDTSRPEKTGLGTETGSTPPGALQRGTVGTTTDTTERAQTCIQSEDNSNNEM